MNTSKDTTKLIFKGKLNFEQLKTIRDFINNMSDRVGYVVIEYADAANKIVFKLPLDEYDMILSDDVVTPSLFIQTFSPRMWIEISADFIEMYINSTVKYAGISDNGELTVYYIPA